MFTTRIKWNWVVNVLFNSCRDQDQHWVTKLKINREINTVSQILGRVWPCFALWTSVNQEQHNFAPSCKCFHRETWLTCTNSEPLIGPLQIILYYAEIACEYSNRVVWRIALLLYHAGLSPVTYEQWQGWITPWERKKYVPWLPAIFCSCLQQKMSSETVCRHSVHAVASFLLNFEL